ncbi:MAG TPA: hypothetical protein VG245_00605 [Candidatus Dormibacteraeota bacterium]|jgi:hypothetical protein|nr:hypothetical protein [Candidatus Dormibacteraeota bacterium]
MTSKRNRLNLNRETVRELGERGLTVAAGGLPTQVCTGMYPTLDIRCGQLLASIRNHCLVTPVSGVECSTTQ